MIVELKPWHVVEYAWGMVVKHAKGHPEKVIFRDGQELDVSEMNISITDEGILFREEER